MGRNPSMAVSTSLSAQRSHPSLLSRVKWGPLGRLAKRELLNREVHAPVVSAYRWWARRPHCVMGAILDAAVDKYGDGLTVADPFSGGGTVTFEAARRGLKAYAQDLYPWPARGLASALQSCDSAVLAASAQALLCVLAPLRAAYRNAEGAELSHILRVRSARCVACERRFYQFPHPLVSVASRSTTERHAYFGCYACGTLSKRLHRIAKFSCDACRMRWSATEPLVGCVSCSSTRLVPTGWHAVLVQELQFDKGRWKAALRRVRKDDPVDAKSASEGADALISLIPPGKETKRLVDNELARWGDLYTQRQVDVLIAAISAIKTFDVPVAVKDRLAFSVLGASEMAAFLSRWDRLHLKSFEAMANHRYAQTTLAVETNLLSPVGRGTLPRRLQTATVTLRWLIESCSAPPKVISTTPGRRGRKRTDWDVLIASGSSTKQALRDASVSVVVTDPPYCDDVQYGELARLFHTWLHLYDPTLTFDERHEAVPNSVRGTSIDDYENTIAACLIESRRTLKDDGTLVLTFHNKKLRAWKALAGAICKSGFYVKALAVVRAENGADHCKRNVSAMLHDLVIECEPMTRRAAPRAKLEFKPRTLPEFNLAAMGLALAECARVGSSAKLQASYEQHLARWTTGKRLVE